jgi:hypothetical protein
MFHAWRQVYAIVSNFVLLAIHERTKRDMDWTMFRYAFVGSAYLFRGLFDVKRCNDDMDSSLKH